MFSVIQQAVVEAFPATLPWGPKLRSQQSALWCGLSQGSCTWALGRSGICETPCGGSQRSPEKWCCCGRSFWHGTGAGPEHALARGVGTILCYWAHYGWEPVGRWWLSRHVLLSWETGLKRFFFKWKGEEAPVRSRYWGQENPHRPWTISRPFLNNLEGIMSFQSRPVTSVHNNAWVEEGFLCKMLDAFWKDSHWKE